MVVLFLAFWGPSILIYAVTWLTYIQKCSCLPTSSPTFFFSSLHDTHSILTGVGWNLNVDLISISQMAKDVELFFMYLLSICTFFENCSVHLSILLIGLSVLLVFNFFEVFILILDINLPLNE
jgi:hypothetical protein